MSSPETKRLARAVHAALAGTALVAVDVGTAIAQDQDDAEQLETITVVGSRIKRTDIETSQPVFVLEREDLQKTGLTSVGDILQRISTNGATLNTTFNNGGNGSTLVDLRNLEPNRTLVLVNSRRWNTSLAGVVDLNEIPVSIIERIEVLKDGASAIYGSDAIAGVINITTRQSYDGAEASVFLGENEEGDGRQELYEFTVGSSNDRASVVANVSYAKQEPILAGDREISQVPLFGFNGNNVNVGASSTTPFGRVGGPGISGTRTLTPGRPGCRPNVVCAPSTVSDFRPFALATDGYNFAPDNYLSTPQERVGTYLQGRYQITDQIAFRTEVVYNERRSEQQLAATPLTVGAIFGGITAGTVLSSNSIYNPFGINLNRVQYRNTIKFRSFNQDVDSFRFGGGFDGAFDLFDRSFIWDVGYVYTDTERRDITDGLLNLANVTNALGPSFIDSSGTPRCGTAAAVIAGCVPLNVLGGPDGVTQAMIDYISFVAQELRYKEQTNYTANLTGDLFELPAGPLAFAAGYEYRRESGFDQPDALIAGGQSSGNIRQPTSGGFALDEFYIELNVPLLKDSAFAEILELSLAARYSDYSTFGDTTNPKFGFRWKPFGDLLVRGNYAEGFRAPNVSELFLGNSDSFPTILDPCSTSASPSGAVLNACRNGVLGVGPVPVGYEQANSQIRITVGGNPNLLPETARNKTLGLVYSPGWLEGLDIYLDWYNIEIVDAISTRTGQFIINDCYRNASPTSCALITRLPTGDVADLFAGTQNLPGGTETEGYDFTVTYRFDTRFGNFAVNWDNAYVSYIGDVDQPEFGDILPDGTASLGNLSGTSFDRTFLFTRLKSNITTTWQRGDWGATLGLRYLSGVDEDCSVPVLFNQPNLCSNPVGSPQFATGENFMDEVWYVDLQGTWDTPWNGRIAAGVRNLSDEDPPVSFSNFSNSFDPQYDIPGRFWYVRYTQQF
jgi:iron complex outermembrane receptor protein